MQLDSGSPTLQPTMPTYLSTQQGLMDSASSLDLYLCLYLSKHRDRARHTHAPSAQLIAPPQLILAAEPALAPDWSNLIGGRAPPLRTNGGRSIARGHNDHAQAAADTQTETERAVLEWFTGSPQLHHGVTVGLCAAEAGVHASGVSAHHFDSVGSCNRAVPLSQIL